MTVVSQAFQFLNRSYNGRPLLAALSVLAAASAVAFWIWPTPYREWVSRGGKYGKGPIVHHRINRFNGTKEYSFPGFFGTANWQPESSPAQQTDIKTTSRTRT